MPTVAGIVWRRRSRAAQELVAECEAVLCGRYASYLGERGRLVPVWAWTNVLAHGDEADLRRLVRSPGQFAQAPGRWAVACAYVAGEVLDLAERYGPLADVQAAILVPLEIDPARRTGTDPWYPRPWVTAVTAALDEHRQARRRAGHAGAGHPRPTRPPPC